MISLKAAKRRTTTAALALGAAVACAQQPFDLDPSFRTTISEVYVSSMALMPDGKHLVSGEMKFGAGLTYYLMRLNSDGSRDLSFPYVGAGGGKITPWNDLYYVSTAQTLRRLMPTGLLDNTFQHLNDNPQFSSFQGGDYHVYPDGSVVITGSHTVNVPDSGWVGSHHMIWFNNDGTLDLTRQPRKGNGTISLIVPQPDGKFLLSGAATAWEGVPKPNIFRVNADGTLDTSFNCAMGWGEAFSMTVLDDGRIVTSGLFKTSFASPDTLHSVRLMPDGSLDPAFHNDLELETLPWLPPEWPNNPVYWGQRAFPRHQRLSDGRIVLIGSHFLVDGQERKGLAMLDPDGNLLPEPFIGDGCGRYYYDGFGFLYGDISGLIEAPDGYIYIWGAYHGYDDGTTNDPDQRFVSRLYGLDVGVRENELAPLQVQPNPTHGPLSVTLPANTTALHAEVLDANGRMVWSKALSAHSEQLQLDLSALREGAYVLHLRMEDGSLRNGRVVILK